jgi:alpha-tubulin suppressor-like RCC1 family protein
MTVIFRNPLSTGVVMSRMSLSHLLSRKACSTLRPKFASTLATVFSTTLLCWSGALFAQAPAEPSLANRLFDFAQPRYPAYFPGSAITQTADIWTYRYYAATGVYLGVNNSVADKGGVYVLGGPFGTTPIRVGKLSDFLSGVPASIVPVDGRISAGFFYSMAVTSNGDVLAWGTSSSIAAAGTTVRGTTARRINGLNPAAAVEAGQSILARSVVRSVDAKVQAWEALAATPATVTALGTVKKVVSCDGSIGNDFALLSDGTVRVRNGSLLAGLNNVADIREDTFIGGGACLLVAVKTDGTVWEVSVLSSGGAVLNSSSLQVTGLPAVVQASCSEGGNLGKLCLALSNIGDVYVWASSNTYGQLGNGISSSAGRTIPVKLANLGGIVRVLAGDGLALALADDGTLYRWGFQPYDAPILSPTAVAGIGGKVVEVAASYNHVLALREDGTLWAWGANERGQLGDGSTGGSSLIPVKVLGVAL